jgi:uncharacterized Zn finger protein
MPFPQITDTTIRQHASAESFLRGSDYFQQGAVLSLVQRGATLQAEVEGSEALPYIVRCIFATDGTIAATCTCAYDWGGWCKHIVATCLVALHRPDMIEERLPLEHLLSGLNRDQLQSLLLTLAEREATLIERIEAEVVFLRPASPGATTAPAPAAAPRRVEVNPKAIRRQVRSIIHSLDRMRSSEAYWQIGAVVDDVRRIVDQAWTLIQEDDGRNALTVLEAVTEEYLADWENLDDSDGEASGFFSDLGLAWAEALLSADLTRQERTSWAGLLTGWQEKLNDYGVDDAFDVASTAALDGWDYPPLKRVLQGTITKHGAWKGEPPLYADELTEARLHILERRGRFQEYLYLAEAEGQTEAYVTMLVRLERFQEAVAYGRAYLGTTGEALALAKALAEHGEGEQAVQMAEHGLTLEGSKTELAKWLRDQARAMGNVALALTAAEAAFREETNLANYLSLAEIAGEQWPQRRPTLLEHARHTTSYYPQGQVEIFLHEGLIDDAIAVVEPQASHTVVEQVVDAALTTRPEWAIQACRKQAEPFMNEGKAQYYSAATRWLAKARTAYRTLGQEKEWQAYLSQLLTQHARKYKLVPMLKALS